MSYRVLLADADGTLFNFQEGERNAIARTFETFQIPATENNIALYHRVNEAQWKRLERGETTQARLRVERFVDFLNETGLRANPEELSKCFVEWLSVQRVLIPGALALCARVSAQMPIFLVTNGIARVQRGRFTDCELAPYLSGLVISEEVGYAKPHPAMVLEAMRLAGVADPREAVLLGDSLTADIAAAANAGVDSILFTNGAEPPGAHGATYVARTLADAQSVILGGSSCLLG